MGRRLRYLSRSCRHHNGRRRPFFLFHFFYLSTNAHLLIVKRKLGWEFLFFVCMCIEYNEGTKHNQRSHHHHRGHSVRPAAASSLTAKRGRKILGTKKISIVNRETPIFSRLLCIYKHLKFIFFEKKSARTIVKLSTTL
jgi:hypothetical protein